jgi:hypothetical protein
MHEKSAHRTFEKLAVPRLGHALIRAVASVRRTAPTIQNADRLWRRYTAALKDDLTLAQLVRQPSAAGLLRIDGMTEVLSRQDIFHVLTRPGCLTLELPSVTPARPPRAFLMIPYATTAPHSIEAFRSYFLGTVFDPVSLQYASRDDEQRFQNALDKGNLGYLSEFVSPNSSAATMALLIAAHAIIVDRIFQVPDCILLGKCLESVRIGSQRNELGNQLIKRLATSFGLRKIGEAAQNRRLALPHNNAPVDQNLQKADEDAELVFGLYMGSTLPIASLAELYAKHLDESAYT